jgi:hypothetical protein
VDEVLKLSSIQFGVQNSLDLVLLFSSNNERWERLWGSTGDRIGAVLFQQSDMKDRMDLHGLGQIKAV